ncbi:unnamed protein product [Durusdinium trenchii]|uniref:Uncharacterized protein n=1 Tax=Durusdinium trenchii TaxID=1381693 RepID=A0ABP0LSI7_9DINO
MDQNYGLLICIYGLEILTALQLLSQIRKFGGVWKFRTTWLCLCSSFRQFQSNFQEWQKTELRVTRFFERMLCKVLRSSAQVMLVALFLRMLVIEWHFWMRTSHNLQPSMDLANVIAYAVVLVLCSWQQLVTPGSLDLWYLLLQTLCTIPLLSTSVADTIIVSLATLLPRFLLGLCARHLWLALLGGAIHWAVSLHSIFSSLSSSDLLFAQTAELLIYYAGVVTIRQQMYENVKMSVNLQKRTIELGAASCLLLEFCDAVVELDEEMKITVTSNQLSTLLLRSLGSPPPDLRGSDFLQLFVEEDRELLHTSLGSTVRLELLHTQFQNADGQKCRLVGLRECQDTQDAASVAPLKDQAPSVDTSRASLLFDACSFEVLGATEGFAELFPDAEKDKLEQMSISDLLGPSETVISTIQSAVNTFDPAFKRPISLGCVEIFHQRVQATLTLQNDDLLKTIVGTLAISTGTTNARSKRTTPRHARSSSSHDDGSRRGSILDLRKEAPTVSL